MRNTRSPHITGEECPFPGILVFHLTFSFSLHRTGGLHPGALPSDRFPRQVAHVSRHESSSPGQGEHQNIINSRNVIFPIELILVSLVQINCLAMTRSGWIVVRRDYLSGNISGLIWLPSSHLNRISERRAFLTKNIMAVRFAHGRKTTAISVGNVRGSYSGR